jgi:hypothetical protein
MARKEVGSVDAKVTIKLIAWTLPNEQPLKNKAKKKRRPIYGTE